MKSIVSFLYSYMYTNLIKIRLEYVNNAHL